MTTSTMPKWPDKPAPSPSDVAGVADSHYAYERASADAAMARLRLAVEALRNASDEARSGYYDGQGLKRFVEIRGLAEEALAAIGELPGAGGV